MTIESLPGVPDLPTGPYFFRLKYGSLGIRRLQLRRKGMIFSTVEEEMFFWPADWLRYTRNEEPEEVLALVATRLINKFYEKRKNHELLAGIDEYIGDHP